MKRIQFWVIYIGLFLLGFTVSTYPFLFRLGQVYTEQSDYAFYGYLFRDFYRQISAGTWLREGLFNLHQFYPWPSASLYSDLMWLGALIFFPFFALTQNLVLSLNLVTVVFFFLNYSTAYFAAKYFFKKRKAAIFTAIIYTFFLPGIGHFPDHLQLQIRFFFPLIYLYTFQFLQQPNKKSFWLAAIFFTLNIFTNVYYFIFGVFQVVVQCLVHLYLRRKELKLYLLSLAKYSFFLLPFLLIIWAYFAPYLKFFRTANAARSLHENMLYSARPIDYVTTRSDNQLYHGLSHYSLNSERALFLGLIPLIMFFMGLVKLRVKSKELTLSLGTVFFLSVVLSFGPILIGWRNENTGIQLPYYWLFNHLVFLSAIRVPARFVFLLAWPLAMGGGFALELSKSKHVKLLTVTIILLFFMETWHILPIHFEAPILKKAQVLKQQKKLEFLNGEPTVHYPTSIKQNFGVSYLGWISVTGEKAFNGYSGYFPPDWKELGKGWDKRFNRQSLEQMKTLGFKYLLVHSSLLNPMQAKQIKQTVRKAKLKPVFSVSNLNVYSLEKIRVQKCSIAISPKVSFQGFYGENNLLWSFANPGNCYSLNENRNYRYQLVFSNEYTSLLVDGYFVIPLMLSPHENWSYATPLKIPVSYLKSEYYDGKPALKLELLYD